MILPEFGPTVSDELRRQVLLVYLAIYSEKCYLLRCLELEMDETALLLCRLQVWLAANDADPLRPETCAWLRSG
jgi:hypothetical protein